MSRNTTNPTFMEIMSELRAFKGNDRSLVLIASGYLELLTGVLVRTKCKNHKSITEDHRTYSFSAKLLLLNEIGAIEDSLYRAIDRFRKLRNRAAHDAIFSIGKSDAKYFMRIKGSPDVSLGVHCIILISLFWKAQSDVFNRCFRESKEPKKTQ